MADPVRPGPRQAEHIARNSDALQRLWRQASHLHDLGHLVQVALGEPLAAHVHVLSLRGTVLSLAANSAAIASELRFEVPGLMRALGGLAAFRGLTEIRIRVVPRDQSPPTAARLGGDAAASIRRTVPAITDPRLRDALLALAAVGKRS